MSGEYSQLMTEAQGLTASRDWRAAAEAYARAAQAAALSARADEAWQAWTAAGACWRRADRPADAERCLRRALDLTEPSGTAALRTAPELAAVLADLGAGELAEELLESIAGEQAFREMPAVFLDTRVGVLVALGRKEAARVALAGLSALSGDDAGLATRFRQAQMLSLDGELGRAKATWKRLVSSLLREPSHAAGAGAALAGLAEVELLVGDERAALEHFEGAAAAWRAAGREAPACLADAGRVRAMVALGVQPLPNLLDPGMVFAEQRGMTPLLAHLRLARGLAHVAVDPVDAEADLVLAMNEAMTLGLPLLVGQAAFERAMRLPAGDRPRQVLLDTAAMALVSHVPLAARVALARARLLARFDPAQARAVARACLPRLEGMGMSRDLLAARALVRQLG